MGIPVRQNIGAKQASRSLSAPPKHLEASFQRLARGLRGIEHCTTMRDDNDATKNFSRESQLRIASIAADGHDPSGKAATTNANLMACLSQIGDVDTAEEAATAMSELVLRDVAATVLTQANQLPTMTFRLLERTSRG